MKRGWMLLVVFLLSFSIVTAYEGVEFSKIDSTTVLNPGEKGSYTLQLENLDAKTYKVQIQAEPYVGLPSSYFQYVFVDPNFITLAGHETVEIAVEIKLKEDAPEQNRYKTYITATVIDDEDLDEVRYDLQVFLLAETEPLVMTLSEIEGSIAPGGLVDFSLTLENKLDADLSNIDVYVVSELFEDSQTIELFGEQEKEIVFSYPTAFDTAPGDYDVNVRVYYDEELRASESISFSIEENVDVTEAVETVDSFLKTEITITKENNGNSQVSEPYSYAPSLIQGWFVAYSLDPSYEGDGLTWLFTLDPGEEGTLVITINYQPFLVGLIVLILLALIFYYIFTKRITIKKEVFKTKYSTEGVSDFKVLLHVRNNTNKPINHITIMDRLPKFIQPTTNFGLVRPDGVERGAKGVRMMWKIGELVSGEERIITYEVEAKMKVLGEIQLPRAVGKYKNKRKRTTYFRSNRISVLSGIVDKVKQKAHRKKHRTS